MTDRPATPADALMWFQSRRYLPEAVADVYVRRNMSSVTPDPARPYLVLECLAHPRGAKGIGSGGTIREYLTAGADIPEAVRREADSKTGQAYSAVKWWSKS